MPKYDAISRLLPSLTKAEVSQALRSLRGKKLEMFKEMVGRKKFSQEELGPAIASLSPENFGLIRAELTLELAILTSGRRQGPSPRERARKQELHGLAFQYIGEVQRAITAFTKGADLLQGVEDWYGTLHLLGNLALLLAHEDHPELDDRIIRITGLALETVTAYSFLQRCRELKRIAADDRLPLLPALEAEWAALPVSASIKARLFTAHAGAALAMYRGDVVVAEELLLPVHQQLVEQPGILDDSMASASALSVQLVLGWTLMNRGEVQLARETHCDLVAALRNQDHSILHGLLLQLRWLEITDAWTNQRLEDFDALEQALGADIEAGMFPSKQVRGPVSAHISGMCLRRKAYRRTLFWYAMAYDAKGSIVAEENLIVMALAKLMAHFMLEDWEVMDSNVLSVRRLLASRKIVEVVFREVTAAFLKVAKNPRDKVIILNRLQHRIDGLLANKGMAAVNQAVNLEDWIRAQIASSATSGNRSS